MKTARIAICIVTILFTPLGCSQPRISQRQGTAQPTEEPLTFVNRVWRVAESTGMSPGQLVVFLSEGTLVFASPNEKPALGTWTDNGRTLTMVEEGIPYKTDILRLSKTEFRIRSHNPGGVVETRFVPADGSPLRPERR
jgi:hypothetical protein